MNQIMTPEKAELAKKKEGVLWLVGIELGDYLNKRTIAQKYFGKSREWLSQRIIGNVVNGKKAAFKPEEYDTFTAALRDIADQFNKAADMIDSASLDD